MTTLIQSVTRNATLTTVHTVVDGKRFEYTSHNGGAWEVYDHPKAWKGVPRFIGYLPPDTGCKLDAVLLRDGHLSGPPRKLESL